MPNARLPVYLSSKVDRETYRTIQHLKEHMNTAEGYNGYYSDKYYPYKDTVIWENSRGYIHILLPKRYELEGQYFYCLEDWYIATNGKMKYANRDVRFKSVDDIKQFISEISDKFISDVQQ